MTGSDLGGAIIHDMNKILIGAAVIGFVAFRIGHVVPRWGEANLAAVTESLGFAQGRLCESHCRLYKKFEQDGAPPWFVNYELEFKHDARCDCGEQP